MSADGFNLLRHQQSPGVGVDKFDSGFVGGVPLDVLRLSEGSSVTLSSTGSWIGYVISRDTVEVFAADELGNPDGSGVSFSASRGELGMQVSAYAQTVYGERTKAFPPKAMTELFDFTIERFNDRSLLYIWSSWDRQSVNTTMYRRTLEQFGPYPTEAQKLAAANDGTWSGSIAVRNGYFAEQVFLNGSAYKVTFTRGAPYHRLPQN